MKRVIAHLTAKDLEALQYLARAWGVSETVALQRALALKRFLLEEKGRGGQVLLKRPDGRWVEVLVSGN